MRKRVLSAIQPTGSMHLGNYFGAVKNWVQLQETHDCFFGVVDLHAMTMPYDPAALRKNSFNLMVELLACGLDPEKCVLFVQSNVPQHTELAWIFSCVTSYGELSRMTQFKDKTAQLEESAKGHVVSAGLFTYPILQAADILVYRGEYVPVGKDQEQHLELTRNIAIRFNTQFGDCFPEPQGLYTEAPKLLSTADPSRKMSKSAGEKHYIGLFEPPNSITKKIKSAVTDSGDQPTGEMSPGVANLITLIRASGGVQDAETLTAAHAAGELRYKNLKEAATEHVLALTERIGARKQELLQDPAALERMIDELSAKAREEAAKTLQEVRKLTGLPTFSYR